MSNERERRILSTKLAAGIAAAALGVAVLGIATKCSAEAEDAAVHPTNRPVITLEPSLAPSPIDAQTPVPVETPIPTENREVRDGFITIGPEIDLSLVEQNLIYAPDGHTPYLTFSGGKRRYFISSAVSTYMVETNGESLKDAIQADRIDVQRVLEPDSEFDYTGITSVFQLDEVNENHLTAILHQEERRSPEDVVGVKASVAKVESFDGGLTWINKQTLIWGANPGVPGGPTYSGAGQPNAIQMGEYLYLYYIDWTQGQQPDQIYLARTKVANGTIDGNMEFYSNGNFGADLESQHTSVIPAPDGYSALPSISNNSYLNQLLCVYEGSRGFYQTTSIDGINWTQPILFAEFGNGFNRYTYPTLISDEMPNDHTTGKNGILYYAKAPGGQSHNLVAREFEIK